MLTLRRLSRKIRDMITRYAYRIDLFHADKRGLPDGIMPLFRAETYRPMIYT